MAVVHADDWDLGMRHLSHPFRKSAIEKSGVSFDDGIYVG